MTVFRTIISRATRPAKTSTNADKHTAYDRNNWRIQYKIAMLVNKCLRGPPPYLAELYWPVVHLTGRRHLRSAASGKLDVQRTATAIDRRNFAVSGPETGNSLPAELRLSTLSTATFARRLKAHLFVGTRMTYACSASDFS